MFQEAPQANLCPQLFSPSQQRASPKAVTLCGGHGALAHVGTCRSLFDRSAASGSCTSLAPPVHAPVLAHTGGTLGALVAASLGVLPLLHLPAPVPVLASATVIPNFPKITAPQPWAAVSQGAIPSAAFPPWSPLYVVLAHCNVAVANHVLSNSQVWFSLSLSTASCLMTQIHSKNVAVSMQEDGLPIGLP